MFRHRCVRHSTNGAPQVLTRRSERVLRALARSRPPRVHDAAPVDVALPPGPDLPAGRTQRVVTFTGATQLAAENQPNERFDNRARTLRTDLARLEATEHDDTEKPRLHCVLSGGYSRASIETGRAPIWS